MILNVFFLCLQCGSRAGQFYASIAFDVIDKNIVLIQIRQPLFLWDIFFIDFTQQIFPLT